LRRIKTEPFELTWASGGEARSARLTQVPTEVKDEYRQKSQRLDWGLRPRQGPDRMVEPEWVTVKMGPGEALSESLEVVPRIIGMTAMVFGRLFTGQMSLDNLGGPIMMYQIASKSAEQGMDEFFNVMAGISINLGLMNLLPIPILDGFHLLAAFWEAVRRRPIPVRAREIANMVGLAMLILLMVLVMKNDLTR
ncbi:MAG TPA: M50 family metallopeptidase, partial [Myxococcaceae bacterium]|nr:M50 family metallopeptidase [Myxococcaceae bacterium]